MVWVSWTSSWFMTLTTYCLHWTGTMFLGRGWTQVGTIWLCLKNGEETPVEFPWWKEQQQVFVQIYMKGNQLLKTGRCLTVGKLIDPRLTYGVHLGKRYPRLSLLVMDCHREVVETIEREAVMLTDHMMLLKRYPNQLHPLQFRFCISWHSFLFMNHLVLNDYDAV